METERVSMLWPADLKEQVRRLVGGRGLTEFTVDAVRDKLTQVKPSAVTASEPEQPTPDEPERSHPGGPAPTEPAAEPGLEPAEVAKLPLARRMAYARAMIQEREGVGEPTGLTADLAAQQNRCPRCRDELVDGECWSCPPV
jgi:hypothetical protein